MLDRGIPGAGAWACLGRLCAGDVERLRALSDRLGPEEWRAIRLGLERQVFAANVAECLRELADTPGALLLAGGVAEVAVVLSRRLRQSPAVVATADVAGRFGPRYAAATGLVLLDGDGDGDGERLATSGR